MKALIISLFIASFLSNCLEAQNKASGDSVKTDKRFRQLIPQISPFADTTFSDKIFRQHVPEFMPGGEYRIITEPIPDTTYNPFPGSSRYYAKRPELIASDKHFIMNPDTSSKYYLIIKNPLTNKITR